MLTANEKLRYSRQIMLKKVGEAGQLSLRNASVLIVGMGGLGNPVSLYLAAAGVGKIIIADGDDIDITNLHRQILFNEKDMAKNKADCANEKLIQHNTDVTIEVIDEMLDDELCQFYIPQVDIVIDCSDNVPTRYLVNKLCIQYKKPFVVGAVTGFDGQQLVVDPRKENFSCYQCLFPETIEKPKNNCQSVGVIGPILSIIAGMQALQTIKLLVGLTVQHNQLNLYDGLTNQWQQFSIPKKENCPVCGNLS